MSQNENPLINSLQRWSSKGKKKSQDPIYAIVIVDLRVLKRIKHALSRERYEEGMQIRKASLDHLDQVCTTAM